MNTISFYSYKGGVGRSLALANLGVYLAQFGATVTMVDFDLEAPGLHYKLQPEASIAIESRGLAGILADVSRGASLDSIDWDVTMDVSSHTRQSDLEDAPPEQNAGRLFLVPAGNPMAADYWTDLAAIDWDKLFTSPERPGVAALARLKEHLRSETDPDVLLVDSRTGITPGGGVSTTLLPDVVVLMMLNTAEHLDGTRLVTSAVVKSHRQHDIAPTVVPVLSRYTNPDLGERRRATTGRARPPRTSLGLVDSDVREDIPLDDLWATLVGDLNESERDRVHQPLVIHADLALQHKEYLAFGPYAEAQELAGQTLLEDYVRLFADIVPADTVRKYVDSVRERARLILLDNPDDAIRTLESLATHVGDEVAFVDLVKVYVLRRDTRNLLRAAERLFRVHKRIVPHPALTNDVRGLLTGRGMRQRMAIEGVSALSADFAEAYWRHVAPDDVEWGASLARFLVDRGQPSRAKALVEELIERDQVPDDTANIIKVLARGGEDAEELAVQVSLQYFDGGHASVHFLKAATIAARYRRSTELAGRILEAPSHTSLSSTEQLDLLVITDRAQEAGELLLDVVTGGTSEPIELDELRDHWQVLVKQLPYLRAELQAKSPEVLDQLDTPSDDNPF